MDEKASDAALSAIAEAEQSPAEAADSLASVEASSRSSAASASDITSRPLPAASSTASSSLAASRRSTGESPPSSNSSERRDTRLDTASAEVSAASAVRSSAPFPSSLLFLAPTASSHLRNETRQKVAKSTC